jgi:hypothetical protein
MKNNYTALAKEAKVIKMQLDSGDINIPVLRNFLGKFLEASDIPDKPISKADERYLYCLNKLRAEDGKRREK